MRPPPLFVCVSLLYLLVLMALNYLRKVDLLKQACFIAAACPLLLVFWWPLGVWYSSLPNNPDPLHYRELLRVFWDLCGFSFYIWRDTVMGRDRSGRPNWVLRRCPKKGLVLKAHLRWNFFYSRNFQIQ